MADEQARTDRAREEATIAADIQTHMQATNKHFADYNGQLRELTAEIKALHGKLMEVVIAQRDLAGDFQHSAKTAITLAQGLREQKQAERENVNSGRGSWQFILLILAGAVSVGSLVYTIFGK